METINLEYDESSFLICGSKLAEKAAGDGGSRLGIIEILPLLFKAFASQKFNSSLTVMYSSINKVASRKKNNFVRENRENRLGNVPL